MFSYSRWSLAALVLVTLPGPLSAGKVKVWQQNTPAHFEKARMEHVVLSNEGTLRLSFQLEQLADLDATHVWDLLEDGKGNVLVATGDEGKLVRIGRDGRSKTLYRSPDCQIFCLTPGPDGSVFAGTGPAGNILRITANGKVETWCETGESYVWSLAWDAQAGILYAGTGPKGQILSISPDGKAKPFYHTKQEHILSLALTSDSLYAGTDKGGLVYRIDRQGKGFILHSAPQQEVRRLLVTPDGVYAATSSPTRRRGSSSAGSSSTVSRATAGSFSTPGTPTSLKRGTIQVAESTEKPAASASETSRVAPAPAPTPPTAGENSLYRISTDGSVREVFREKALLLSLLRQDRRLLIGSGMDGQLFEVNETTKERCEIARLDHGQIHCLCQRRDGSIVLGTGDPGKLYVLRAHYVRKGTITSEVYDARLLSKWGALRWAADCPAGTAVTIAVRSGNVAEPDDTWSAWSQEETEAQQATARAPAARFVQYRVTLTSDADTATPILRNLSLRYLPVNLAPEITSIDVPDLETTTLDNPKKLKFKWTSTDPNEDELTYRVFLRKEGWQQWVELEDNYERKELEQDTTTTPSGIYRLKVVASDRRDNPAEEALTGERISAPFVVSHTPPLIKLRVARVVREQGTIEATAEDSLVRLTAASFSVDGRKWTNVFPVDGLFDSRTETFRFQTEALKSGTHVLVLRVRDAAGNTGSGDVVFTVP